MKKHQKHGGDARKTGGRGAIGGGAVKKKTEPRRHIEDAPFYKLQHGFDDLPLDPVRPFILEKIRECSLN